MGIHYFTDEQVKKLQLNPYVRNASNKSITYTNEFRQFFIEEYEKGLLPRQILRKAGFDPEILGKERIRSISKSFRKMAARPEGTADTRKNSPGRPRTKDLTPEEEILRLKHKIKYLEQENMFLKKINILDRKARQEQDRRKSSKSSGK